MTAMAERKLGDIFKRFIPLGLHKEIFDNAAEVKVRLDKENRIAEVRCALPKLYRKKDLYELEGEIARTYELNQMRILPRYPAELFTTDYISDVLMEAARVGVVINGFFNRYELEADEESLKFRIPFTHGGISLLDLARTGDVISGIIFSEFGLQYKVEILQADNAQSQYEAFMQGQLAQLQSQSAIIMREAERLEAEGACLSMKQLAVNGKDMANLGYTGREIGAVLEALLDSVIIGQTPNNREILLTRAEKKQRHIRKETGKL